MLRPLAPLTRIRSVKSDTQTCGAGWCPGAPATLPRAGRPGAGFMSSQRLNILCVCQMPASPPRFGAQVRTHALMPQLARHHELTAVMLVHEEFDIEECRRAMQVYCREVDWSTTAPVGKVLPNGCCNSGPWPPPGASTGCGSQCQRCTGRWTRSSALGGLTSSTWNFRTLATASCARLRPAQYVAARGARREEVGFGDCHCEVELTRIHRRCARRDGGRHGSSW